MSREGEGSPGATKSHRLLKGRATLNHAPQNVCVLKKPKRNQSIRAHEVFAKSGSRLSFVLVKVGRGSGQEVNWGRSRDASGAEASVPACEGRKGKENPRLSEKGDVKYNF